MSSSRRHAEYLDLQNREQAAREAGQQRAAAMREAQMRQAYAAQQQQRAAASGMPSHGARRDIANAMDAAAMRQGAGAAGPSMSMAPRRVSFDQSVERASRAPVSRPVPPRMPVPDSPVPGAAAGDSEMQISPGAAAEMMAMRDEHLAASDPLSSDGTHSAISLVVYALQLMLLILMTSTVYALPTGLRWVWLVVAGHVAIVGVGAALSRSAPQSWAAENVQTPLFAAHALLSLVFLGMTAYRIVTLYRADSLGAAVLGQSSSLSAGGSRDGSRDGSRRSRKRMRSRASSYMPTQLS